MRSGPVAAKTGKFFPILSTIAGAEQRCVFHSRVYGVWIVQRRLKVPHTFEFPGMRSAVVPLVRSGHAVVHKFIPYRLPRFAAIVTALNQLPEPPAALRRIQTIRIHGRSFNVVHLPAGKVRTVHFPLFALSVGSQNERALASSHQQSHAAHLSLLWSAVARHRFRMQPSTTDSAFVRDASQDDSTLVYIRLSTKSRPFLIHSSRR